MFVDVVLGTWLVEFVVYCVDCVVNIVVSYEFVIAVRIVKEMNGARLWLLLWLG